MEHTLSVSGEYLDTHPPQPAADAAWQAANILRMMCRHQLAPASVAEIGCAAGEILRCLERQLPEDVTFTAPALTAQTSWLTVSQASPHPHVVTSNQPAPVDLALALDVFEQGPDTPGLLHGLARRARHIIFHIPLDLSLLALLTGLPPRTHHGTAHANYFTRAMALDALDSSGFRVLDDFFTRPTLKRPRHSLTGRLTRLPRLAIAAVDQRLAATLLGGFSLMVLAEAKESR